MGLEIVEDSEININKKYQQNLLNHGQQCIVDFEANILRTCKDSTKVFFHFRKLVNTV